jgi:hypothetical protein
VHLDALYELIWVLEITGASYIVIVFYWFLVSPFTVLVKTGIITNVLISVVASKSVDVVKIP